MSVHPWEAIVQQIEEECDPAKIAELGQKLNDAMLAEERQKVKQRLGISADRYGSGFLGTVKRFSVVARGRYAELRAHEGQR